MKKLFAFFALCAALTVSACMYTYDLRVNGVCFPYIGTVNGIKVTGVVVDRLASGPVHVSNPGTGMASTNLPITITITTAKYGFFGQSGIIAGNEQGLLGLAHYTYHGAGSVSPGVTMKLYYSTDRGEHWILANKRNFASVLVGTVEDLPFGRDVIPITLSTGSILKLRLVSFPTEFPECESYAHVGDFFFETDTSKSDERTSYFCHEVTILINGPRRGGR